MRFQGPIRPSGRRLLPTLFASGLILLAACAGSSPSAASGARPEPTTRAAAPAATPVPAATPAADPRGRAEALLARVVDAMGGAAVVDGVKTLQATAKVKRKFPGGNEVEFDSKTAFLFPDWYRQEARLPMAEVVTVWVPEGAFTDMGNGPVLLPAPQGAALEDSFRRNLVSLLQARARPGFRATASSAEGGAAAEVEPLEIESRGLRTTLEIDPATGRVRRLRYLSASAAAGIGGETVVEFSDWRTVTGLSYPFGFSSTVAGKPAHAGQVQELTVNAPLDRSLFEPKGTPVPAEPVATPAPVATAKPGAPPAKTPSPGR